MQPKPSVSEYMSWKNDPISQWFFQMLEQRLAEVRKEFTLYFDSADQTQAHTAQKEGRIEILEDLIEYKPERERGDKVVSLDGQDRDIDYDD